MPQQPFSAKVVRSGALGAAGLACAFLWSIGTHPAQGRPQDKNVKDADAWKDYKYEEARTCMDCHIAPTANRIESHLTDIVLLSEYPIWKTIDKHAQAYAVLELPRGQRIGELLYGKDRANLVLKEEAGCLSCHAMYNLSKDNLGRGGKELDLKDGVSCGGCHGPSSKWTGLHDKPAWREMTAAQKAQDGMRDVRDPRVRAELCMSCHIGNVGEGKVVTHAMFAAGHPPLPPIEISSFSKNMPQHWRDPQFVPYFKAHATDQKVIDNYHLGAMNFKRSRFALVGSVVALREAMKLARDRANFDAAKAEWSWWPELRDTLNEADSKDVAKVREAAKARWPELAMAHSDCFACHHELKYPGFRQERGFGYHLADRPMIRTIPGRPLVRTWSIGLIQFDTGFANKANDLNQFSQLLDGVAKAASVQPYGKPAEVYAEADKVVSWCDAFLKDMDDPSHYTRANALKFIQNLCAIYSSDKAKSLMPDYETARQVASVVKALYQDTLIDELGKDPTADKVREVESKTSELFGTLDKSLDLQPYKRRDDRTKVILEMVSAKSGLKPDDPDTVKAVKAFSAFAGDVNVGNPATMIGNKFISAMRDNLSNAGFTAGLKEMKVVDALQKLSDQEEKEVLTAVKSYDPATFKDQLKEIAAKLSAK